MKRRVVFDTNTVLSALLFGRGRLTWLRNHWRDGHVTPMISTATAGELMWVLSYPKFRSSADDQLEILGDYLPCCETVQVLKKCSVICRDVQDQAFLDLAHSGRAEVLVTGDEDLLVLQGKTKFTIETGEAYRLRVDHR